MVKINFKNCQSKKENKNIKPFIEFYLPAYFPNIKDVDIDCPDKNNQQKAPDYFLEQPKIAVEIKEVHERGELEQSMSRVYSAKRLQKELDKRAKDLKFPKSVYFLSYPWYLKIKRGQEKKIAETIINAIGNNQKNIFIEGIGDFEVISKSEGKESKIVLATSMGPVRSINPAGTIHQNIGPKIEKANKQLGAIKANKKILLLVNKYIFGYRISEFIEALSYSYKELLTYKNIDEIWLQLESATGRFSHILIYERNFLNSFEKAKFKKITKDEIKLLEGWFYPLSKLEDEYKEKLFIVLKQFLKNKKPYEIFNDKFARQEMVQLGIWLAEKERFSDVIWIIDRFIGDPDPEEPKKYSGDPKFNYHRQIIDGEHPHIITTVLGHLAWVIQKLAVHKNYIVKALDYTKKLLSHKNLYVKLQAIIPLIEISARRQWLEGWSKRPREGQYKEFHKTVFDLINLVKENPNYKAIGKWLCHIFEYYKDLSTKEAEQVLDALKITDEAAGLFVYFGIFRQRHYKGQDIEYNGQRLEKKLKEIIKNSKENYQRLRASITWHLWKVLDENRNEFETIQPYIDLLLEQPYQRDIYDDIERIISGWIKDRTDICIQWYKQMLSKVSDFAEYTEKSQLQAGLWLMYTEEIVETIARYSPNELLEIMEKLVSLWEKGVFIGSPKRLFESYKLVSAENQRIETKKRFQKWYNSMRRLNPKIERVNWG
jgi:hypothetical protein